MARRASSGPKPVVIVAIVVALIAALFIGKFFLTSGSGTTLTGAKLPVDALLENANALRGNEYVIEGTLDDQLAWTVDRGQVVALKVDSSGGSDFLAIEIPPNLSDINIEREQAYAFRIRFRDGGIAVAQEITRL